MPARLSRHPLIRCWIALLLLAIGLQAAVPAGPPLQVLHGSAFSATTVEVALVTQRRDETAEAAVAPTLPNPLLYWTAVQLLAAPGLAQSHVWLPAATGLFVHRIRSWHPSPRAPPRG